MQNGPPKGGPFILCEAPAYFLRGGIWINSATSSFVSGFSKNFSFTASRTIPSISFISSLCMVDAMVGDHREMGLIGKNEAVRDAKTQGRDALLKAVSDVKQGTN